jgi:hypothetical protein
VTTTEENLRTFMLSDSIKAVVGARVSYNKVPQDKDAPYIFFQQQGAEDDVALDDSAGTPTRPRYAIELWDHTPAGAIALKNLVQARLNKHRGAFGDTTVKGIFASDADDEYVPNGAGDDDGLHGTALFAEVVL